MYRVIAFILICCIANAATAEIYKCQRSDGSVQFADRACADGKSETLALQENSALDSSGYRTNTPGTNSTQPLQTGQRAVLLGDNATEERNTRVRSAAPHRAKLIRHKTKRPTKAKK